MVTLVHGHTIVAMVTSGDLTIAGTDQQRAGSIIYRYSVHVQERVYMAYYVTCVLHIKFAKMFLQAC